MPQGSIVGLILLHVQLMFLPCLPSVHSFDMSRSLFFDTILYIIHPFFALALCFSPLQTNMHFFCFVFDWLYGRYLSNDCRPFREYAKSCISDYIKKIMRKASSLPSSNLYSYLAGPALRIKRIVAPSHI